MVDRSRSLPSLVTVLTSAGVLPFVAGALYLIIPFGEPHHYGLVSTAMAWWAVIILSFMAGTYWGMAVTATADPILLVGSNLAAIAAWGALLLLPPGWVAVAIAALYALLLALEWRAYATGLVPLFYLRLRMVITSAVVLCLCTLVMAR